jgi:hypothetical protein
MATSDQIHSPFDVATFGMSNSWSDEIPPWPKILGIAEVIFAQGCPTPASARNEGF